MKWDDRQPIHITQLCEKVTLKMSILRDLSVLLGPSGNKKEPAAEINLLRFLRAI